MSPLTYILSILSSLDVWKLPPNWVTSLTIPSLVPEEMVAHLDDL
jgi:hypothetical protein